MSILSNRIKKERENLGLTREALASKIGVSYSAIAMYEQGNREPNNTLTIKLCEIFDCSVDYLMGKSEYKNENEFFELHHEQPLSFEKSSMLNKLRDANFKNIENNKTKQNNIDINADRRIYACPVYGRISAGQPNWAEECIEGRLPIDPNLMGIIDPEECYFLRVNGESMNKVVDNGAYALIRKTDWVENGEIAVVLVNGFDATLKKFSKQGDLVVLEPMSNDNSFQVQIYDKNTPVEVIGKYIGKFEMKQ